MTKTLKALIGSDIESAKPITYPTTTTKTASKIAVALPSTPGKVILDGNPQPVDRAEAERQGATCLTVDQVEAVLSGETLTINEESVFVDAIRVTKHQLNRIFLHAGLTSAKVEAQIEALRYADAILALPEASNRPFAVLSIIQAHNAKSLPPETAARFLRGLPAEYGEAPATVEPARAMQPKDEATLRRRLELRAAALAVSPVKTLANAEDLKKLNYALTLNKTGTPLATALDLSGVELSRVA